MRPHRQLLAPLSLASLASFIVALLLATAAAEQPLGRIRFRGQMAVGTSEGEFRRWEFASAVVDEEAPQLSKIEVVIDLRSVDTGNATRDRHLRSEAFLDVEHYPRATARLSDFKWNGADNLAATVELDLHGHTRTFPMIFAVVDRGQRLIRGRVMLNRHDFGIGPSPSELNLLRVGAEIEVEVDTVVPLAGNRASTPTPMQAGIASR